MWDSLFLSLSLSLSLYTHKHTHTHTHTHEGRLHHLSIRLALQIPLFEAEKQWQRSHEP